jgi:hypothetical protein
MLPRNLGNIAYLPNENFQTNFEFKIFHNKTNIVCTHFITCSSLGGVLKPSHTHSTVFRNLCRRVRSKDVERDCSRSSRRHGAITDAKSKSRHKGNMGVDLYYQTRKYARALHWPLSLLLTALYTCKPMPESCLADCAMHASNYTLISQQS